MPTPSPQQLVHHIVDKLIGSGFEARIETEKLEDGVRVVVHLPESERGRVIGQGGRTARALRTVVRAAGAVADQRYQVIIADE